MGCTIAGRTGGPISMRSTSLEESVALIPDGASLMIGGFMAVGTPERLIDEIVHQGKRDLTVIANDTATPGYRKPHRTQSRDTAANDGRRTRRGACSSRHAN